MNKSTAKGKKPKVTLSAGVKKASMTQKVKNKKEPSTGGQDFFVDMAAKNKLISSNKGSDDFFAGVEGLGKEAEIESEVPSLQVVAKRGRPKKSSKSLSTMDFSSKGVPEHLIPSNERGPNRNGLPLARALDKKRRDEDLSLDELSAKVDLSKVVMLSILNRSRKMNQLGWDTIRKIARYLEISPLSAAQMAGAVDIQDFMIQSSVEDKIAIIENAIRLDKRWGGFLPSEEEFAKLPIRYRLMVVLMYKELHSKDLEEVAAKAGLLTDTPLYKFDFVDEPEIQPVLQRGQKKEFLE